jgi:hypothetical protein
MNEDSNGVVEVWADYQHSEERQPGMGMTSPVVPKCFNICGTLVTKSWIFVEPHKVEVYFLGEYMK